MSSFTDNAIQLISRYLEDIQTFLELRNLSTLDYFKNGVFFYVVFKLSAKAYRELWARGPIGCIQGITRCISTYCYGKALKAPYVRNKVDKELSVAIDKVKSAVIVRNPNRHKQTKLPIVGKSEDDIKREFETLKSLRHSDWENGKVSGAVYHCSTDLWDLQTYAYSSFIPANQLHPDVFPGLRALDSEVVSMVLDMYNAPSTGVGTSTSGGTESLLLACLSARTKGYVEYGITEPEIVAPITVHAGFDKAAYYFKMKLRHAPVNEKTGKVDISAVKRMINSNTVLIVGSAPSFPHGIIDDIEELSKIAVKKNIPLHVDCCLGSFIVPFLEQSGLVKNVPLFDFRLPGVTSISCDTHKYGYAPKGSSVIMYRNEELRAYQYFILDSWVGGLYGSPTLAGSRPGALMAGCWATMVHIGKNGYLKYAKEILKSAQIVKNAIINEIPELKVIGDPIGSVVAFKSDEINIYSLADRMAKKGWHLNSLQKPAAVHIAVTAANCNVVDKLIAELKLQVAQLKSEGSNAASSDTAVLYGFAGSIASSSIIDKMAIGFLDALYTA